MTKEQLQPGMFVTHKLRGHKGIVVKTNLDDAELVRIRICQFIPGDSGSPFYASRPDQYVYLEMDCHPEELEPCNAATKSHWWK